MRKQRQGKKRRKPENELLARAAFSTVSENQTYLSFTLGLFQSSRLFRVWERYVKYFRRFRFVTTAMRLLPWILLLISTNTLLYAIAAVAVILVPLLVLTILSLVASAPIRHRSMNDRMAKHLFEKTVYVIFPERAKEFAGAAFWKANVLDLAADSDARVVIVSPFLLSPRGLNENRFYFNARRETPNVFLVRRHYFFSLRRNVLIPLVKRLILIY